MSSQEESQVEPGARLTADLRAFSVTRMEQYNFDTLREEEKRGDLFKGILTTITQDTHHRR